MTPRLQKLSDSLARAGFAPTERFGELTIEVKDHRAAALKLRDELGFEQLIDLCGVDYASYGDRPREGLRFAVVVHLLSVTNNCRVRLRSFCADDEFPVADGTGSSSSAATLRRTRRLRLMLKRL